MAQVKLLKIDSTGISTEFNSASDEITLNSFTVQGGGPVLSGTGLDLNNQNVEDIKDVKFNNSSTAAIFVNGTSFLADKMMFESKENSLSVGASVLFPVISDDADQVDALRIPSLAGIPTAAPTDGGAGYLLINSLTGHLFMYNGTSWDDLNTVDSAENIQDTDYTADEALLACDAVYISADSQVSKALGSAEGTARLIGFAVDAAADTDPVLVQKAGVLGGFSGLTIGARYYLSPSSAGLITTTLPVGSGNIIVQAGYAKSATELDIQIQQLGKRA